MKEQNAENTIPVPEITDRPEGQLSLTGVDPLEGKEFSVRKRDGRRAIFNDQRIFLALEAAFKADLGLGKEDSLSEATRHEVTSLTHEVVQRMLALAVRGEEIQVERIQDMVETEL